MKYRCRSCQHYTGRECRRHPPVFHQAAGRAFPVVREDDYCGEHKLVKVRKADPRPTVKAKPFPGPRPKKAASIDMLIEGHWDSYTTQPPMMMLGLLEVLGDARGDKGMVVWTKTNLQPFKDLLDSGTKPSTIAKACRGWLYDPSGWWNGMVEGQEKKHPTPAHVLKHFVKFLAWYDERRPREAEPEKQPEWLRRVM